MTPTPKQRIAAAYHAAADHFDDAPLSFWDYFGHRTVERAGIAPGEIVLDVCSGSGASALPAARAAGPTGRVIGLDLAPGLVERARTKAAAESLTNIEFRQADFDQAYFRASSFDAVVCVFGIFFLPDMPAALAKMRRLLRPGGRLAITVWGRDLFEPASSVFWNAVREVRPELYRGFNPWDSLTSADQLRALLPDAEIEAEDRDHPLHAAEDWWTIVMGSGYRGTVDQLTPEQRDYVRRACLSVASPSIRTPALYAIGKAGLRPAL